MDNLKKTLPSGAILEVTMSEFTVGEALFSAVVKELEQTKINLGDISSVESLKDVEITSEMIDTFKNLISRMISSPSIKTLIWKCLERATRNDIKITPDIFEDVEARGDYLTIFRETLWFNISPFFPSLNSLLKVIKALIQKSQNIARPE